MIFRRLESKKQKYKKQGILMTLWRLGAEKQKHNKKKF